MSEDPVRLSSDSVDAVARRVVELLQVREHGPASSQLITASEVAVLIGCSRDWVYANADVLGVIRLPSKSGQERASRPRARLRFSVECIALALGGVPEPPTAAMPSEQPMPRSRRAGRDSDVDLLPVGRADPAKVDPGDR